MTYAIAAAGTGGHIYPALAVGEALTAAGVAPSDVVFIGGDRLEATVFPKAGFPFERLDVWGFQRSRIAANMGIPRMLWRARSRAAAIMYEHKVRVVLGFGNYITVPVALAAASRRVPLFLHEQNAHPGLANRVASRWARASFVSFPDTPQLRRPTFTGNPLRALFHDFDRDRLRPEARARYHLADDRPTLGVFGGSLGARAINQAVVEMLSEWGWPQIQVVHLAGRERYPEVAPKASSTSMTWTVLDFEDRMDLFYAAVDLVVARAGGGIAEILATGTPAILVPGGFGSGGHQLANARYAAGAGAAVILEEARLSELGSVVGRLIGDRPALGEMRVAARKIARPDAAETIATRLLEAARD